MFDVGDEIGPYKIVRRLGAGGMGEVFQGRHRHMHRDAAIKVLREELSTNAEVVRRFFTEARATAAVRHPAIIEIFDCDVHPRGSAFIVMELLEGEDLAKRLAERGSFLGDLPGLRAIARQVANGLGAAHDVGIVHRDLKPGNIFLAGAAGAGPPAVVKILDFGIAKLLYGDVEGHERTRTGNVLGTPLYMSPEQARGARAVDHRADIYALGCVLFEMLSGRPPFVDKAAAEVIVAHIFKPAPRVSSLVEGVPAALDELVAAMLEKEPAARPQTMKDVAARLLDDPTEAVAAAGSGRVATRLLGSGRAVAAPVAAAPPTVEAPRGAPAVTAPSPALRSAKTEPSTEVREIAASARDARQFTRAGSTTLGSSAGELETQAGEDHDGVPRARRRWLGPAVGAGVVAAGALVLLLRGGSPPTTDAPATAAAPSAPAPASPAPAAPVPPPVRIEVSSRPSGADLWVGQEPTPRGRTPLSVELAAGASRPAQLRLAGHAPVDLVLDPGAARPITIVFPASSPAPEHHPRPKKIEPGAGFKAIED
jgi:tRNA A-37 threonylcarbamoyl transferase component Bud32